MTAKCVVDTSPTPEAASRGGGDWRERSPTHSSQRSFL